MGLNVYCRWRKDDDEAEPAEGDKVESILMGRRKPGTEKAPAIAAIQIFIHHIMFMFWAFNKNSNDVTSLSLINTVRMIWTQTGISPAPLDGALRLRRDTSYTTDEFGKAAM